MSLRVGLIFAAVAVLWGVPFALIEVALDHGAEPLLIAWTRVAIGAAVLLALAAAQGKLRGLRPYAGALVVIAIADVALPFTLVSFAQEHVSSSLAGILIASTPLFVGALAGAIDPRERPSRRGWAGLLLGFAGVVALLGLQLSGELTAAAMLLLAAVGYAVATLLVRRLDDSVAPLAVSALALGIATVLLAPGAAVSLPTGATAGMGGTRGARRDPDRKRPRRARADPERLLARSLSRVGDGREVPAPSASGGCDDAHAASDCGKRKTLPGS
jgi:drug/metabolite transporter (DMT)-like permease